MGQAALAQDERFATHDARWINITEINALVGEWIRSMPVNDVIEILEGHGLPHSLVYSVDDILADPHYAARGAIVTLDHPKIGALKMPAPSPRMSGTPARTMQAAPDLGADNDEIYGGLLGMDAQAIAALRAGRLI